MKITRQTDSELRAEHRPRFLPILIAALLVGVIIEELIRDPASGLDLAAALLGIGVGIVLLLLAMRGSEVRMDAAAGTLRVGATGPFSGTPTVVRLGEISDVTLKTGRDRSRSQLVFVLGERRVGTTWHSGHTPRDREAVDAMRSWLRERGVALASHEGELRVGHRIRVTAPDGQTRAWLPPGEALMGRVEGFLPATHRGSLDRAVVRLDRTTAPGGAPPVGDVEARWLLLTQRDDPTRWYEEGEVHVVAYRRKPKWWTVGLDRTARAQEGTGVYTVLRQSASG